jgi:signal recognition particle receptor subunit beta/predicted DNA-binding transcriptional regulator AlpA
MTDQVLGVKEIASIANVSAAVVSNWQGRYKDFPQPVKISGIPVFDQTAITDWLTRYGHKHNLDNIQRSTYPGGITKSLAVIGKSKVGKTTLVTKFTIHEGLLKKFFSGSGGIKTMITFKFNIWRRISDKQCKARYISHDSTLNGIETPLDEESLEQFISNIKENNFYSEKSGKKGKKELDPKTDMIEITTSASALAWSILDDEDGGIIVYDTPGVGDTFKDIYNVNANYYILMFDSGEEETFTRMLKSAIKQIGSSRILFVFSNRQQIDNEEDYRLLVDDSKKAVNDFSNEIKKIVDEQSIINTTCELLYPSESIIPMGSFKISGMNFAERKFIDDLSSSLREILSSKAIYAEENALASEFDKYKSDKYRLIDFAKDLIKKAVSNCIYKPPENAVHPNLASFKSEKKSFDIKNFLTAKHDRVKFNDGYQIYNYVERNKKRLLTDIYNSFKDVNIDETAYPDISPKIQRLMIQYCYKRMNEALRQDCGISRGNHPFEDPLPLTMWALESVISDNLFAENITLSNDQFLGLSENYVNVMKKFYNSYSWGYVKMRGRYTGRLEYCNYKIDVIDKCKLFSKPAISDENLIYNCYNTGLMLLGVYGFYDFLRRTLNFADDIIDWL